MALKGGAFASVTYRNVKQNTTVSAGSQAFRVAPSTTTTDGTSPGIPITLGFFFLQNLDEATLVHLWAESTNSTSNECSACHPTRVPCSGHWYCCLVSPPSDGIRLPCITTKALVKQSRSDYLKEALPYVLWILVFPGHSTRSFIHWKSPWKFAAEM